MLLHRLVELAARDGSAAPFHRERVFDWRLDLTATGELESRSLTRLHDQDATGKPRGVSHPVPSMVRTVGVAANLAADDAQYVLGWADEASKPARVAQCHAAFVDLIDRWASSDTERTDSVARAISAFYRGGGVERVRREEDCTAKSGVLIRVAGKLAHEADSVRLFWAEEVARRKGAAGTGLCLVCGRHAPLLDTLPGKVPSRLVPGATNDTALVSVNERVFGYDLAMQLGASPICISCGEAVTAGLVRALDPTRSSTYGGQDSRLAWWTNRETEFDAMSLLNEPSENQVSSLLASVHRGRANDTVDPDKFCALTVGGNVARVMVRDWLEMPLRRVQANVAAWFADHEMEPTRREGSHYHGLGRFSMVTGRWLRDRGRYADFGAKGADRPDGVHRDLVRAALRKTPLPPSLLVHLVHRTRTDGRLDDARAALIRLILVRHPLTAEKPMPRLDETNTTPTYVAGRLFATYEQIQYDVSAGRLNTTYGDRFFAGAIANPRVALLNGRRDSIAWLRKLRNWQGKKGVAVRHEKTLDALYDLLDVATDVPSRTTIREQSLFLLGYHHQRAAYFSAARARTTSPDHHAADEETSR